MSSNFDRGGERKRDRQERLAAALRENLRRRKAAPLPAIALQEAGAPETHSECPHSAPPMSRTEESS